MSGYTEISRSFFSNAINGRRVYRLLLPQQGEENPPLLTLLHGVHGSEIDWLEQGHVDSTLNQLTKQGNVNSMAILLASDGLTGIGTGYLNWMEGKHNAYEDYLLKELIPHVEQEWKVGGERSKKSLAGLSMGGYASIRIGLEHPEMFTSVSSLSVFFDVVDLGRLVGEEQFQRIFQGDEERIRKYSPIHWENILQSKLPSIYFDCGTKDLYLDINRKFHQKLLQMGIVHEYKENRGKHSWEYWKEHIKEHLIRSFKGLIPRSLLRQQTMFEL